MSEVNELATKVLKVYFRIFLKTLKWVVIFVGAYWAIMAVLGVI